MTTRTIGVFLFNHCELLDVAGPVEIWASIADSFRVQLLGPSMQPVDSSTGPTVAARLVPDDVWETNEHLDIIMVPGGRGTRTEVENQRLLTALKQKAANAEYVTSVCTGSAILAKAGLLDGKRATSNKRAFAWVQEQGPNTTWVASARWVVDGNVITSGGVAAGMDMALGLVGMLHGDQAARKLAAGIEYDWHDNARWDPFAKLAGIA